MYIAETYRKQNQQGNRFALPSTKKVLATQLGITAEALSGLFNRLKTNGLIQETGACITVPNFSSLCREVDLVEVFFKKNTRIFDDYQRQ